MNRGALAAISTVLLTLASSSPRAQGPTSTDGSWQHLTISCREGATAIYDAARDRMLMFGGYERSGYQNDTSYYNDTWVLSMSGAPIWTRLATAGTPPSNRYEHTAIYDAVRDRMIVFGGTNNSDFYGDVWSLSLSDPPTWTQLNPVGTFPIRYYHSAIYDPLRDRMLIYGGLDGAGTPNDCWALSLSETPTWSQLTPAGTIPIHFAHTAIYDPERDRMLVFGGSNNFGGYNDCWALSLSETPAWSQLVVEGTMPTGRYGHIAIYDHSRNRMVISGGFDGSYRNDAWALSLSEPPTWSQLATTGTPPVGRAYHVAIYDSVRDRLVSFGGRSQGLPAQPIDLRDTWALSLAEAPAWTELSSGTAIPARFGHSAIYDSAGDRMVVFGGNSPYPSNDTWTLSLSDDPQWMLLSDQTMPPTPTQRAGHSAIYDPVQNRMVIFGGGGSGANGEMWALALSGPPVWTQSYGTGAAPPGRSYHTAVYDRVHNRMIVFGGTGASMFNDTWALSFSGIQAWSQFAPSGSTPSPRNLHTAIYDSARDRMLIFGGADGGTTFNDVWALSLSGSPVWTQLLPAGAPPAFSYGYSAIYDPAGDRMLVLGGISVSPILYALPLSNDSGWTQLSPTGTAPWGQAHSAVYDALHHRMVIFGGWLGSVNLDDATALNLDALVTGVNDRTLFSTVLNPCYPNPFNPSVTIPFELKKSAEVDLTIYDVTGNHVRTVFSEWASSGSHAVAWDGRNDRGQPVASGTYFCQFRAGGVVSTRKITLLK